MMDENKTPVARARFNVKPVLLAGLFFAAVLAAFSYLLLGQRAYSQGGGQTHVIEISGLAFEPAELTVREGDTIIWVNVDPLVHTATADDGSWDSGLMASGDEWEFVADTAGEFDYTCTPHPQMTGSITVEAN